MRFNRCLHNNRTVFHHFHHFIAKQPLFHVQLLLLGYIFLVLFSRFVGFFRSSYSLNFIICHLGQNYWFANSCFPFHLIFLDSLQPFTHVCRIPLLFSRSRHTRFYRSILSFSAVHVIVHANRLYNTSSNFLFQLCDHASHPVYRYLQHNFSFCHFKQVLVFYVLVFSRSFSVQFACCVVVGLHLH